jgi:hypothetical protein
MESTSTRGRDDARPEQLQRDQRSRNAKACRGPHGRFGQRRGWRGGWERRWGYWLGGNGGTGGTAPNGIAGKAGGDGTGGGGGGGAQVSATDGGPSLPAPPPAGSAATAATALSQPMALAPSSTLALSPDYPARPEHPGNGCRLRRCYSPAPVIGLVGAAKLGSGSPVRAKSTD